MAKNEVKTYTESVTLKIKPWGDDSPLPNLYRLDDWGFWNSYPYNHKDDIKGSVEKRKFSAMVVENEYVKVSILPDMGVRIFSFYDKVSGLKIVHFQSMNFSWFQEYPHTISLVVSQYFLKH